VPAGASWFPGDLSWYRIARDHLLIGSGHRLLWRSRGRFASPGGVDAIALGPGELAFSYFSGAKASRLFLARLGAAEVEVAHAETPFFWTNAGTLLTATAAGELELRDPNGQLRQVLAHSAKDLAVDREGRSLYFVARGLLQRFDGAQVTTIADLRLLGVGASPSLTPLAGLLAVAGARRLLIFGSDGRSLSSTSLPAGAATADVAPGAVAADLTGTVAFTTTSGNTAYGSSGVESVYLLRPGEREATRIFSRQIDFALCERQATLAWRAGWVLYAASEGYAAAIDTGAQQPPLELSALAQRLPGLTENDQTNFDASWDALG
jgi:hypothetical protein